jgi:hypothetical protein
MTTQQDSVDVERQLRFILDLTITPIADEHAASRNGKELIRAKTAARKALAALSLPITQRDEQSDRTDAIAACLYGHFHLHTAYDGRAGRVLNWPELPADNYYRRSCLEAAEGVLRLPAIRRLSIEQGDQDGGAE